MGSEEVTVYCIEGGVVVAPVACIAFIGFIDDEEVGSGKRNFTDEGLKERGCGAGPGVDSGV